MSRRAAPALGLAVAAMVLVADQATKEWARATLPFNRRVPLVQHWLAFGLTVNSGAAFGSFSGLNGLLAVITGALLVAAAVLVAGGYARDSFTVLSLGAIFGGGLSNLVDRLRLGSVVDFIQVRFWPSDFNLADLAIRAGAVVLVAGLLVRLAHRRGPT